MASTAPASSAPYGFQNTSERLQLGAECCLTSACRGRMTSAAVGISNSQNKG